MSRPIRVGALHSGMRVIESGVQANERVIVNGLQRVRPGVVVDPKLAEMPSSTSDPEAVELSGDPAKLPAAAAK
jgi:hypothetical protein